MTAVIISLAVALAGALGTIAWLVYRTVGAVENLADEREDHSATTLDRDRARFERDAFKLRMEDAEKRLTALAEEMSHVDANPNSDLDPGDVAGRVRRAAQAARADRADPVRAGTEPAVPAPPATGGSEAAGVSRGLDPHERLL